VFVTKLDAVVGELKQVNQRLERVEGRLVDVEGRVIDVEKQMAKNNAGLQEVRLSVIRLADKLDKQDEIEKRLAVLEKIVLK
jgi:predicted  nucleic acid-binding Zn-ribbon protein